MTFDYLRGNRQNWDDAADSYAAAGERNWATSDITWGVFGVSEASVGMLPDVAGSDVLEAGCGTGYVSAWIARRGGRPVGIDNSRRQLETAARLQRTHQIEFPLIHGIAEQLPFRDASFDVVVSEYGASLWADPHRWIPEAARVLRPGGELTFLTNSTIVVMCVPEYEGTAATSALQRGYFDWHRITWPDTPAATEFHLTPDQWIDLLVTTGFEVRALIHPRVRADAHTEFDWITAEWAQQWPVEDVWRARKPVK